MRKVIGITIAVFMLAGSLVGCGNSDTEKSKTATVTSIETQAETEETVETTTRADYKDGWGSTTSNMGADTGNCTKLRCGMSLTELADLGYGEEILTIKLQNFLKYLVCRKAVLDIFSFLSIVRHKSTRLFITPTVTTSVFTLVIPTNIVPIKLAKPLKAVQ